jgi:hypothetical protein
MMQVLLETMQAGQKLHKQWVDPGFIPEISYLDVPIML